MSKEKYLGMIVGRQQSIQQKYLQEELKKEKMAQSLASAFALTDVIDIWEAAKDVMIQDPFAKPASAGITIPLGKCGKYVRYQGQVIGLSIKNELLSGPAWKCVKTKTGGVLYYMQQFNNWNTERFAYHGTKTPKGASYTAADVRDSFLEFMVRVIPPVALAGIEPVVLDANDRTTKRKLLAPA